MEYGRRFQRALHEAQEMAGAPRVRVVPFGSGVTHIKHPRWNAGIRAFSGAQDSVSIQGFGVAWVPGRLYVPFANLVTTAGDQYYARKAIVGVSPANPTAPTAASGMKLGTGTTAAAKSGTGAALITYLAASNVVFDASFPTAAAVSGTNTGWQAQYQCTWAAGVATSASINEVVVVNDAATNATTSEANTYSRAVLATTVDKAANEPLIVTWYHKFLGA